MNNKHYTTIRINTFCQKPIANHNKNNIISRTIPAIKQGGKIVVCQPGTTEVANYIRHRSGKVFKNRLQFL